MKSSLWYKGKFEIHAELFHNTDLHELFEDLTVSEFQFFSDKFNCFSANFLRRCHAVAWIWGWQEVSMRYFLVSHVSSMLPPPFLSSLWCLPRAVDLVVERWKLIHHSELQIPDKTLAVPTTTSLSSSVHLLFVHLSWLSSQQWQNQHLVQYMSSHLQAQIDLPWELLPWDWACFSLSQFPHCLPHIQHNQVHSSH